MQGISLFEVTMKNHNRMVDALIIDSHTYENILVKFIFPGQPKEVAAHH